jgi:hypothetical protein
MTTAKPPARYRAIYRRACGRLRYTELHHAGGHDPSRLVRSPSQVQATIVRAPLQCSHFPCCTKSCLRPRTRCTRQRRPRLARTRAGFSLRMTFDYFVMAITSAEAVVWYTPPYNSLSVCAVGSRLLRMGELRWARPACLPFVLSAAQRRVWRHAGHVTERPRLGFPFARIAAAGVNYSCVQIGQAIPRRHPITGAVQKGNSVTRSVADATRNWFFESGRTAERPA